ncbi:MAG: valine--tRNA ligase [Bacteroidetes bacterium]|nr:valine--tRNA ligase [Bacteroidota bacterium]MBS1630296.1 valine--tRNA ligase [Bacteroidota bacterium]
MDIAKNFEHAAAEPRWYKHWMHQGYFYSKPDSRPAYTITMPPPNVTGVLHMGHALNNTVQDVLIRRAKAQGFNTCWVPGTDHASIATEAKVVGLLRERGIDKNTLSREEFLKYAWEWKEKHGGIILEQLKRLGCSLDWNRTAFTMDDAYYRAVIRVFVELFRKGLIYRGVKMINWDPKAQTALSDEEVIHKQTQSKLVFLQYFLCNAEGEKSGGAITIATVRPETILGDTAVCVHPNDERYQHLKGAYCLVPLLNRPVPIIFDEYIDPEFGTGALKVTPAHDINDYNLGLKHRLPVIDTLNDDGTLSPAAQLYVGEDRFVVRKKIVEDLKAAGHFVKEEDYTNQVGYSERTDAVIEPRLSMQWWCKMQDLARPALDDVLSGTIQFFPDKFRNLYRHWMENIKDWCISRQLWWGQRIPAWYDEQGNMVVAETEAEALEQYRLQHQVASQAATPQLRQDADCLDTWFSSWLWPMQVFGWNDAPDNEELAYYYPSQTLVTAPEIIFFWVARMIMAGEAFRQQIPFEKVYFTGIVRDKQGRKMSKSLGNSPDLLKLIDEWGSDAVRFSVMIASPAGNDLLYDEGMLLQGRNFCNKMWNAMKLVKGWEERQATEAPNAPAEAAAFAIAWMQARIAQAATELNGLFSSFRLSEALKALYTLIWDDFCSWYLEWVKPEKDAAISSHTYQATCSLFRQLLQLLHPFMPFVTEEIDFNLSHRAAGDDLMNRPMSEMPSGDTQIIQQGQSLQALITAVRDARVKAGIKPRDPLSLAVTTTDPSLYHRTRTILLRQTNASELSFAKEAIEGSIALVVQTDKLYLIAEGNIDKSAQLASLNKELNHLQGFLQSVEKKLSNEKFMAHAKPEVVALERKKQSDALSRIRVIEESLASL